MSAFGVRHLMLLLTKPLVGYFVGELTCGLQIMEDALSDEMPWFSGKRMGLADLNMSFPMDMAIQRGYCDMKKFPKIGEWYKRYTESPAYKRALEKGEVYDLAIFA